MDNRHFGNSDAATLIIALGMLDGVGPTKIASFIKRNQYNYKNSLDSAPSFFKISNDEFENYLSKASQIVEKNRLYGINIITILDKEMPSWLFDCKQPVVILYYIGNIKLLYSKTITVVGTRKPDREFVDKGELMIKKLAEYDYTIVSGLAIGCDTIAHESALKYGLPTIAVLPCACNNIYPPTNKGLALKIVDSGGLLISEYGCDNKFTKYQLPERDRIQSLLSDSLIVIQSSDTGGSMIATERSLKDGKGVMALKGNKLSKISKYINPEDFTDSSNHWF